MSDAAPKAPSARAVTAGGPVLILGIRPRAGTNLLGDLLGLHPALAATRVPEDGLLRPSRHLLAYAREAARFWDQEGWGVGAHEEDALLAHLGRGLRAWLERDLPPGRRVLTKTPSLRGLAQVFRLFPDADVLLLVRDGRAVVESGVRSFGWTHEQGSRKWAEAAAMLRAFTAGPRGAAGRWKQVRYEDLVRDQEGQLREVLGFLGLDAADYDFGAAAGLPVRGSSLLTDEHGRPRWDAAPKPEGFDDRPRWAHWDAARHARFNWIAGEHLVALGYEPVSVPEHALGQRARDAAFRAKRELQKLSRPTRPPALPPTPPRQEMP